MIEKIITYCHHLAFFSFLSCLWVFFLGTVLLLRWLNPHHSATATIDPNTPRYMIPAVVPKLSMSMPKMLRTSSRS